MLYTADLIYYNIGWLRRGDWDMVTETPWQRHRDSDRDDRHTHNSERVTVTGWQRHHKSDTVTVTGMTDTPRDSDRVIATPWQKHRDRYKATVKLWEKNSVTVKGWQTQPRDNEKGDSGGALQGQGDSDEVTKAIWLVWVYDSWLWISWTAEFMNACGRFNIKFIWTLILW